MLPLVPSCCSLNEPGPSDGHLDQQDRHPIAHALIC